MIFGPIFRKDFIAIKLKWYYIKSHEVIIFQRHSPMVFSKEATKPDRSKLEETEEMHISKNSKKL